MMISDPTSIQSECYKDVSKELIKLIDL